MQTVISQASICVVLMAWCSITVIQAQQCYYKTKGSIIKTRVQLGAVYGVEITQRLLIDLETTYYVKEVIASGSLNVLNVAASSRDTTTDSVCKRTAGLALGSFQCMKYTRLISAKGNFVLSSFTINAIKVSIDHFIGCFRETRPEIYDQSKTTALNCIKKCSTDFSGVSLLQGCRCITEMSELESINIHSCLAECRGVTNTYQICGKDNTLAVYRKRVSQKNDQKRSITWKCMSENICEFTIAGRGGLNLEIIVCSENNGNCGGTDSVECQSAPFHGTTIGVCACKPGFLTLNDLSCADIDECSKPARCPELYECKNAFGSFTCDCKFGFESKGSGESTFCADIDECLLDISNNCAKDTTTCLNTPGNFECDCLTGHARRNKWSCQDIDECPEYPCSDLSSLRCVNTRGSYYCNCSSGYEDTDPDKTPSPYKICSDVNECERFRNCHESTTTCINTPGSYECRCLPGYEDLDVFKCRDIDECDRRLCDSLSTICRNTFGSYECNCLSGFTPYRTNQCQDIDECLAKHCDANTTFCRNTPGTFSCHCLSGFKYISRLQCQDIDECAARKHHCGLRSTCINTIGSFDCLCPEKTIKLVYHHSVECQDVDECKMIHDCNTTVSFCLNVISGYVCQCIPGYINVDNLTCTSGSESVFETTTFTGYEDGLTTEEVASDQNSTKYIFGLAVIVSLFALIVLAMLAKCLLIFKGKTKVLSTSKSGGSEIPSVDGLDLDKVAIENIV